MPVTRPGDVVVVGREDGVGVASGYIIVNGAGKCVSRAFNSHEDASKYLDIAPHKDGDCRVNFQKWGGGVFERWEISGVNYVQITE